MYVVSLYGERQKCLTNSRVNLAFSPKVVGQMQQNPSLYYCHKPGSHTNVSRNVFTNLHSYQHHSLPLCIRHEFYDQGSDTGQHLHEDFYALYVVQEGKGVHVINRHPYGIARGDVYVLPPRAIHAYHDYDTLTVDAFYFSPQLFSYEESLALRGLSGFWDLLITLGTAAAEEVSAQEESLDHHLHLSPEQHKDVELMIAELCNEFVAHAAEATLLARSQFFRMLVHLARWQVVQHNRSKTDLAEPVESIGERQKIDIAAILHFCDQHFHESLSVPQLASLMFLSPSRFTEIFSREVGMSPAAYIRHLRLEKAQSLLRTTTLSTTTIAHQVGLGDSAQLSRAFRATFHLTPSDYRSTFR